MRAALAVMEPRPLYRRPVNAAPSTAAPSITALAVTALLITCLITGCAGDPAATPAIQDTSAAGAPSRTTVGPTTGTGATGGRSPADGTSDTRPTATRTDEDRTDGPVVLPWPAPTRDEAVALQGAVDGGSRPWLLEPSEVALSYVATVHGWTDATTTEEPAVPGTVVVGNPDGEQRTLTLAQSTRTGPTGIWLIATDTPT